MATKREILQQALQNAQNISQQATTGQGFDPRGGWGVLAAQLGTAAIGAFAQKKAMDQLKAQEQQEQLAFAKFTGLSPELAQNASPATRQAIMQKILENQFTPEKPYEPSSPLGKLYQDISKGAIPANIGRQALQKEIQPSKPLVEVKTGQLESEEQKALGKMYAKKYEDISEAGNQAIKGIETLQTLQRAVSNPNASQGAFSDLRANAKVVGDLFGLKIEGVEDDAIISAIGNKLALQLRNPRGEDGGLTGNTSDKDLKFLVASVPNRNKTQSQNLALIDIALKDKKRTLKLQQLADQYLAENGTFRGFADVKKRFYQENPLYSNGEEKIKVKQMLKGQMPTMQPQITPIPQTQFSPDEIQQELKRRGLVK